MSPRSHAKAEARSARAQLGPLAFEPLAFEPLTLEHRELVDGYVHRFPPQISEHTFANLFVWGDKRPISVARWQGALLIAAEKDGERSLLGPPLGDFNLDGLLAQMTEAGIGGFARIPASMARAVEAVGLNTVEDPDNADYVYLRRDLAELKGRAYHRQKNLVNKCLGAFDCQWLEITPALLDEVADLQGRWCAAKDCQEDPAICAENSAIRLALQHYEQLDMVGGAIRIGGRLEAYTLGGRLAPDTAVIHFEKAMGGFPGLYQVVNQWFCERALAGFEFVNREQDMGIPGLRKAKMSYRPHHMVTKYAAALEPAAVGQLVGADAEGRCRE